LRVMVALENRFLKTPAGDIYSTTVCDYAFFRRYLQFFDEVIVFARVGRLDRNNFTKSSANGPGVSFVELPYYTNGWEYLKSYRKSRELAARAAKMADAYILRIPGSLASLLGHYLEKKGTPYGVEVVGDPWDSLGAGTVRSVLRPFARWFFTTRQAEQCRTAVAAAYVSEHYLQQRYPPGGWSTHYSSIELADELIVGESQLESRFDRLSDALQGRRPFRICHVGSMSALYKAQDILIKAAAICRSSALKVELVFVGDGRYKKYFMDKASEAGISEYVSFAGRLPSGEQVIHQLDSADLFVLPSLTEGLPRSLIEAMARGLPCIGTKIGGICELLERDEMVVPGDAAELAAKIRQVLSDRARLETMSRRNVGVANKYRASKLNQRRIEFYKKVAGRDM